MVSRSWRQAAIGRLVVTVSDVAPDLTQSPFLAVCRGERPSRVPVWFMRQAGRSLPEYRAIRGDGSINTAIANPDLATEMTILAARRIELETRLGDSLLSDPLAAANLQASLLQLQSEIDELARQLDGLTVFSAVDGRFFTESPADRLGRFYAKGDQLGWVIPTAPARATIALPVTRAASLNGTLQRIEVRLHSRPGRVFEARLLQQQPAATDLLPHAGLGSAGGGAIPVDRTDGERLHTMAPVFLYDIELPAQAGAMSAGARLTVRFVHDGQPLARLIGDRLRQKLQERLKI